MSTKNDIVAQRFYELAENLTTLTEVDRRVKLVELYGLIDRNELSAREEEILNRAWGAFTLQGQSLASATLMLETLMAMPIDAYNPG